MFEERQARDGLFGYSRVLGIHENGFELPNPYLVRLLMHPRKAHRGHALIAELDAESERVATLVENRAAAEPLAGGVIDGTVEFGVSKIKPEFRDELSSYSESLRFAACLGYHLAKLDSARVGQNPPVALGAHQKALQLLLKRHFVSKFGDDTPVFAAHLNVMQSAFYGGRRYGLPI